MSRKSRGKKKSPLPSKTVEAVPEEVLAEGSGPAVEGAVAHVGIDTIAADELEPIVEPDPEPATVEDLAAAAEAVDVGGPAEPDVIEAVEAALDEAAVEAATDAVAAGGDSAAFDAVAAEAVAADGTDDGFDFEAAAAEANDDEMEELTDEEAAEIGAVLPTSAASMDAVQLKLLVEALVFASDKPMTLMRLRQLSRVADTRRLEQALVELAEDYKERGIVLQQVSGGYQFRTRTQFSAWVQQLIAGRPVRLSRAQLETLAIIAYRQPITRPEIDEIRGVDSSATLKLLLDRALIRVLGKKEEVGRPMLYGTTKEFLDFFSLGDLRELPTLREYSELTDESRRVMSDELGLDPDADPMAPIEAMAFAASDDELVDGDAKPASIEDMVASYSAAIEADEAADAREADEARGVEASSDDELVPTNEPAATMRGEVAAGVEASSDGELVPTNEPAATMRGEVAAGDEASSDDELVPTNEPAATMRGEVAAGDEPAVGDEPAASGDDSATTDVFAASGDAGVEAEPARERDADPVSEDEADASEPPRDDPGDIDVKARADHEALDLAAATSSLESLAARRLANEAEAEAAAEALAEAELPTSEPPELASVALEASADDVEPEEDAEAVDTLIAAADASSDDVTSSTDGDTNPD